MQDQALRNAELVTRLMVFRSALSAQDLAPPNNSYAQPTATMCRSLIPSHIGATVAGRRDASAVLRPKIGF